MTQLCRVLCALTLLAAGCSGSSNTLDGSPPAEAALSDAAGPGADGASCAAPLTRCGDQCVDTSSDSNHCGSCDTACSDGMYCKDSQCTPLPTNCGQTGGCPKGHYCDLGSGKCLPGCAMGTDCPPNEHCDIGTHACVCDSGFHRCSGSCVSNGAVSSCGTSCTPCPSDPHGTPTCDGTSCGVSCNTGYLFCSGACATCPTAGVAGTACSGASCVPASCTSGYLLCAGDCASCPTAGVTATACSGASCVPSACAAGYKLCQDSCAKCPTGGQVQATDCAGAACVAVACGAGYHPCATGCCPWTTQTIRQGGGDLDIAVDGQGKVHVAVGNAAEKQLVHLTSPGWNDQVVHTESKTLQRFDVSLALSAAGAPRVAFSVNYPPPAGGSSSGVVRYVEWSGSGWGTPVVLDSGTYGRDNPSLALESSGVPHVAYEVSSCDLGHSFRPASSWSKESAAAGFSNCAWTPSIAVSGTAVHMVFYDLTDRDLVYGQRGSSGWTYTAVDTTGDVGGGAAIAADSAGGLHVVYQDWTNKRDKYVHRTAGGAWQAAEVFDGTHSGGSGRDIVTDAAGRPHICYQDAAQKDLRYAHWTGSSWAIQVVAATGAGCAIALDSAGAPHIVYRDTSNGTVVYAH